MIKFNKLAMSVSKLTGRTGLKLKLASPEILMVGGVIGVVVSTVLACRATLKIEAILDETKDKLDKINNGHETLDAEKYSENDFKKDLSVAYIQTGFAFAKTFGPAILISVISISAIVGSHNILRKRNIALMAAYKGLDELFRDYRKRVVSELGEDKDKQFLYNLHTEKITETVTDENGVTKKVKSKINVIDNTNGSIYARVFSNTSHNWNDIPEYNMTFLKCQQNYANDLLQSRGHIYLNEVYDTLDIKRTDAGAAVGWMLTGVGDHFVDFGIFDVNVCGYRDDRTNDTIGEERIDAINGYSRAILLDFNVDGPISIDPKQKKIV